MTHGHRRGRPRAWIVRGIVGMGLVAAVAGCGFAAGATGPTATHPVMTLAAQDFAEPLIDDWMVRDLIQAHTPVRVHIVKTSGASGLLHALIVQNKIQGYVGYDGTEFTGPLGQAYTGRWRGHPRQVAAYVVAQERRRWGLWVSPSLGYQDTYALGVTTATARRDHLTTDSSAVPYAPHWVIATDPTFQERQGDGYAAWTHAYGLHFRAAKAMDYSLMYEALARGAVQAAVVYSTDPRLAKLHEVALTDNRHFFPPYHGIIILRDGWVRRWHLARVLAPLFGHITTQDQMRLNYDVVVRDESPAVVARRFLVAHHLLS